MADFTPGPWVIVPYGDGETLVIHYRQTQQRVCFMATPSSITDDFPRIRANARLIAAAPELLEALVELDGLREGCSPDELGAIAGKRVAAFVERYRAAIAKARGVS